MHRRRLRVRTAGALASRASVRYRCEGAPSGNLFGEAKRGDQNQCAQNRSEPYELSSDVRETASFQSDAPNDAEKMSERQRLRDDLGRPRDGFEGEHETAEQNVR